MDTAIEQERVAAVCVTFEPDLERLRIVLSAVSGQVERVLVVDNSETEQASKLIASAVTSERLEYRWLGGNFGLSHAFNHGIEEALGLDCSHVLLLDQDSVVAEDMVARLLSAETQLSGSGGQPVAALGPVYTDSRAGRRSTFARFQSFPPKRLDPISQPPVFEVDMLISSGALIPRHALETIGVLDAELFIDHIDTDWCLRAMSEGFRLVAVQSAHMEHRLGQRWARLGRFSLPVHNADRLYFMFRNSWLLYRRDYARWPWILADLRRLVVVFVLHMIACDHRFVAFIRILQGTRDGILGRTGKSAQGKALSG